MQDFKGKELGESRGADGSVSSTGAPKVASLSSAGALCSESGAFDAALTSLAKAGAARQRLYASELVQQIAVLADMLWRHSAASSAAAAEGAVTNGRNDTGRLKPTSTGNATSQKVLHGTNGADGLAYGSSFSQKAADPSLSPVSPSFHGNPPSTNSKAAMLDGDSSFSRQPPAKRPRLDGEAVLDHADVLAPSQEAAVLASLRMRLKVNFGIF